MGALELRVNESLAVVEVSGAIPIGWYIVWRDELASPWRCASQRCRPGGFWLRLLRGDKRNHSYSHLQRKDTPSDSQARPSTWPACTPLASTPRGIAAIGGHVQVAGVVIRIGRSENSILASGTHSTSLLARGRQRTLGSFLVGALG
jgi:hypothetical protein